MIISCIKVFFDSKLSTLRAKLHCANFDQITNKTSDKFQNLIKNSEKINKKEELILESYIKELRPKFLKKKLELEQKLKSINHEIDFFSEDINDFSNIDKDKLNDIKQIEYPSTSGDEIE